MSETVMGIWSSLVRLAGTAAGSSSAALPGGLFQPPSLTKKPAKPFASKPEAERKHAISVNNHSKTFYAKVCMHMW